MTRSQKHWDAVVIGTGFGGSITALTLARAGLSVLVLERGRWVDRDASAWDTRAILIDRKYKSRTGYEAPQFLRRAMVYPNDAVGGNSVFYGAASFRLRETDFERRTRFAHQGFMPPGYVDWPITYHDLAPYYDRAEGLLGVAGVAGTDPTEPPRDRGYASAPPAFGSPARRVADAAEQLGLHPFQIPLAINFDGNSQRHQCVRCTTCDLYPCKLGAKNDLSVTVLPEAAKHGAHIRDQTIATRLLHSGNRITAVECMDRNGGTTQTVSADLVVVSAGAIATPKLLLVSGLEHVGEHGRLIGRYLMRHCSGIAIGLFPFRTNPEQMFHKQVAITDYYFGHPSGRPPHGPWGMIQGLQVPPPEFIELEAPFPLNKAGAWTTPYQIFLLCIAEDIPDVDNRVTVHQAKQDELGQPLATVSHRYHRRDYRGRAALVREAIRILRRAGAIVRARKPINTFSHAVGSCRFGTDPAHAVLDPSCNFFGIPNLFVVDGSFMPTSGGVNPSLTIAANALRVGEHIVANWAFHVASDSG